MVFLYYFLRKFMFGIEINVIVFNVIKICYEVLDEIMISLKNYFCPEVVSYYCTGIIFAFRE